MKLLEEFWYGNIKPMEYDTSACKEYKETLRLIAKNEEKFQAAMSDEQKKLLSRYKDAVLEYQTMSEHLLFQNSFMLGVRICIHKRLSKVWEWEIMTIVSAEETEIS